MNLLETVIRTCKDHGIRVLLIPEKTVRYPGTDKPYLGYFIVDPDQKHAALCCAMLNPSWDEVLLHEFNHAKQWIEGSPAWAAPALTPEELQRYGLASGQEALDVFHLWLDGKIELEPEALKNMVDRSIVVELDCERRTAAMGLELYEEWQLYYHGEYVKKCNGYLRAYKYAELTRVWPDAEAAEVLAYMPEEFSLDYFSPVAEAEKLAFDAGLLHMSPEEAL